MILDSRIRVKALAILSGLEKAEFRYLKEKLRTTDGNLSSHMKKLEEAELIKVEKAIVKGKPRTYYSITEKGKKVLMEYLEEILREMSGKH